MGLFEVVRSSWEDIKLRFRDALSDRKKLDNALVLYDPVFGEEREENLRHVRETVGITGDIREMSTLEYFIKHGESIVPQQVIISQHDYNGLPDKVRDFLNSASRVRKTILRIIETKPGFLRQCYDEHVKELNSDEWQTVKRKKKTLEEVHSVFFGHIKDYLARGGKKSTSSKDFSKYDAEFKRTALEFKAACDDYNKTLLEYFEKHATIPESVYFLKELNGFRNERNWYRVIEELPNLSLRDFSADSVLRAERGNDPIFHHCKGIISRCAFSNIELELGTAAVLVYIQPPDFRARMRRELGVDVLDTPAVPRRFCGSEKCKRTYTGHVIKWHKDNQVRAYRAELRATRFAIEIHSSLLGRKITEEQLPFVKSQATEQLYRDLEKIFGSRPDR